MENIVDFIMQKYGAVITRAMDTPDNKPDDDDGVVDSLGRPTWRQFPSIVELSEYIKQCDGFVVRITRKKRRITLKFYPPIEHDDKTRRAQFDEAFRLFNLASDDIRFCVKNGMINLTECDDD